MKERIKTILLFFLVGLSLFLTNKIWFEIPVGFLSSFKTEQTFSSEYGLSDMIAPHKYILNFGSNVGNLNHTIILDDSRYTIWSDTKLILTEILNSKEVNIEEITKEEYLNYQDERSIVYLFPEKINTYILAKSWNIKNPNEITDAIPNIDNIYVYLGNGDPFFVFSDGKVYYKAVDSSIDNSMLQGSLSEIEGSNNINYYFSMREIYNIDNDIYMPYEMETTLLNVYVSNEISALNDDEQIKTVERFFDKGIDYVRPIVESSGSVIYEYNNRFLKFGINGTLEYFDALDERVPKRNLYISLSTAAEFLTEKAQLQKGMFISGIEEIRSDNDLGYRLTFKYRIRGIPVMLGNRDVEDYIEVEVYNNHIKSYKQLIRRDRKLDLNTIKEGKKIISSLDVLDQNIEFFKDEYLIKNNKTREDIEDSILLEAVQSSIDDISLAYYDPNLKDKNELLIGVWVFKIDDSTYAFNAHTGEIVFER